MITKKVFLVVIATMLTIIVIQALIIVSPFSTLYGVTTEEDAILIARAELLRRYGPGEIEGTEFTAWRSGRFWRVLEAVYIFEIDGVEFRRTQVGYPPCVFVRASNGRAIVLWSDTYIHRTLRRLLD